MLRTSASVSALPLAGLLTVLSLGTLGVLTGCDPANEPPSSNQPLNDEPELLTDTELDAIEQDLEEDLDEPLVEDADHLVIYRTNERIPAGRALSMELVTPMRIRINPDATMAQENRDRLINGSEIDAYIGRPVTRDIEFATELTVEDF